MEDLLNTQGQLEEAINKLLINFKKDGAERKTPQNIKRRLETLEQYWKEFQTNHIKLCEHEDRGDNYFVENHYDRVSNIYYDTRRIISKYGNIEEKPVSKPTNPLFSLNMDWNTQGHSSANAGLEHVESRQQKNPSTEGQGPPPSSQTTERGNSSKLEEMYRKQQSNFKAFQRAINNINLELLAERWEFEDALRTVQIRWSAVDSLHWEIDSEQINEKPEYEETYNRGEQKYNEIKKRINSKMWAFSHREKSTPQMEIPIFSGNYHQWISFKDLFTETIHKNNSISNAQKMQFLKSKVKGEAEKLIQHLNISSENYQVCWEILNNRYNNTKLIFSSHINILLSLPIMQQQSAIPIKKLHDTTKECLHAIENLGVNTSTWDPLIVHLLTQKLDAESHHDYIEHLVDPRELPTLSDFLRFLETKFTALESSRRKQELSKPAQQHNYEKRSNFLKTSTYQRAPIDSHYKGGKNYQATTIKNYQSAATNVFKCSFCNLDHDLFRCHKFLSMTPETKLATVTSRKICTNCLYKHYGNPCISEKRCKQCNGEHNTMLHEAFVGKNKRSADDQGLRKNTGHVSQDEQTETLLSTAQIKVKSADGSYITLRALIDQGSQISLITENAAQRLGLPRNNYKGSVFGIGSKENNCKGTININATSIHNDYVFETRVYIMNRLINNLPGKTFKKPSWPHLQGIQLADPEFHISRPIDILLGVDIYSDIILDSIIRGNEITPIAQQTRLGWILCGNIKSFHCNVVLHNLQNINRFWEIEDIPDTSDDLSTEDQFCINQFKKETTRQADGRYVVRLPLKPEIEEKLGESKPKAVAQFYQLEKKFAKYQKMAQDYKEFIKEYRELGHMCECERETTPSNFLPHHCVHKAESTTTATRVVYNASSPTSSGYSLNDLMYSGPNLQSDLFWLILRWRQYKIAFTADIEKMFRQILCHEQDQLYQKIIWRDHPNQLLQEYALTTVTYGTKAAPFLAMMTLKQLASDEGHRYPEAATVLEQDFYMDDLLSGCHNLESAKKIQTDLISLLKTGGFNLRKWSCNDPELLEGVITTNNEQSFDFKYQTSQKTLGLQWNPQEDVFTFKIKKDSMDSNKVTKRSLLSNISKVFDPLGWLAPITIRLKILFQSVWVADLKWDDVIPDNIFKEWNQLREDMANINKIKIPRWLHSGAKDNIQLHGYSDSSLKAYSCVIFARIVKGDTVSVILLAAKTRVVPISKSNSEVSLPRLELCGAHLLSKLMLKVKQSLSNHNLEVFGWSDSKAVLGWLQGEPNRWKPFVANRVQKITETMPSQCWNYVKSKDNPADCASRGLTVDQLQQHSLWWNGPTSLSLFDHDLTQEKSVFKTDLESKKVKQTNVTQKAQTNISIIQELIDKHSNFTRVYRVLAWIQRAMSRDRVKQSFLTADELRAAKLKIIKHMQQMEYSEDISNLQEQGKVTSKSKILNLNPFLDKDGLLRVNGRLRNSTICEEMKYPLIIPHRNHLTNLLIDHAHKRTFHGTCPTTLSRLREQYWIVGGIRAVKNRLQQCVVCKHNNPNKHHQLMGDLPASRVNPTRPFYHTGVDYTGFVDVKSSKGRGIKSTKGYVAVFVCMVTKAVHLELVSDLTSSAFLAALRRLAARRGTPGHLYSDNGSNFQGASKILNKEYLDLKSIYTCEFLSEISEMEISWHFNAPSWPSAGGLWESCVKNLKHHLRRVVGEQKLTYEEYATLLAQIEACLNARPLCALTEDPNNIDYLTPSHFLASGPTLTIIETERDGRTRWQVTQKIFHDLWKRWRAEYLTQLSNRSKWQRPQPNIKLDDIVIIHDANLPASKWALGRVVDLHPGKDGLVRVVSLKTKNGILKRPIVKLSILPTSDYQSDTKQDQNQKAVKSVNKNNKPNKTKTFKTLCINFMTIIFLLFMVVATSAVNGAYNITALQSNNSIYFDKLSDMRLIQDKWKLVIYYNMEPYWQGKRVLTDYYNHLESICKKLEGKSHCDIILLQLQHGFIELEHYDRMLQNQHSDKRPRTRRGLIDGVGYIANSLFGVLDTRFAEQYQRDITLIRSNQKHLAQFWKNQTSIIEAENNLLKRIEGSIEKQHKIFNQHLNNLEESANILKTMNEFTLSSIIANNILVTLKIIQDNLIDTITNLQHFNVHLLTPEQLRDELSIISGQLVKDLSLPIDNLQTDLPKIYKILKVKARMTTRYFIFELQIPLINRDSYDIYKLLPIPRQVGNEMVRILPVSNYLAMNIQKDTFITISENELHKCIEIDGRTNLCEFQKPVYQRESDNNLCIQETQRSTCKTISSTCQDTWTELININTFLLTCCGQCTLRVICAHQVTTEHLNSVNMIALGSDCVIKGKLFTITSHKQHTNDVYIKPEILAIEIAPVNYLVNLSIPITQFNETNFNGSFENIMEQIKQTKAVSEPIEDEDEISYHDVHHYVAIYVVTAVGLVGAAYALLRRRRAAAALRPPQPSPAAEISVSEQSASVQAEQGEVQGSSKLKTAVKSASSHSVNTASSPIFTRCSFTKIDCE